MNTHRLHNQNRIITKLGLQLFATILIISCAAPAALAYNFAFFGGRLNRPGVDTGPVGTNDFRSSWVRPDNGTITWWLERDTLPLGSCDAACFATLKSLVQPELDKWALWIRVGFSEAPDLASADVVIRFINNPSGGADARPISETGTTLNKVEIRIDPDRYNDWTTSAAHTAFCFYILHEWGHVLGLGDLYLVNHGTSTFEAEDFCDHGLPSGPPPAGGPGLPDTRTKADNVMQAYGVKTLDNDEIHGAEWLWGCAGSNGIVTGELNKRTAGNNGNTTAAHHGLTQTPATWTYRGSVASFVAAPKVTLYFSGIQAARDVGPGAWTPTIFPDRVEFDHAGPWEGNFKFELDCDQGPERYGNAIVAGASSTAFTATPAGGGPQLFPFDQVFGADCGELHYLVTVENSTPSSAATTSLVLSGTESLSIDPLTVHSPGCGPPSITTSDDGVNTTLTIDWGSPCIPSGATVAFLVTRPASPIPLEFLMGIWDDGTGGPVTIPGEDVYIDCYGDRVPNGIYWTVRRRTRYVPLNPFYGAWFHPAGDCWYRWCCYTGLDCYFRIDLYVYKSAFGRFFGARRCIPLVNWTKFRTLPPGWTLVRQTWPPDGVVIEGPIGPPPDFPINFGFGLAGSFGAEEDTINSDDRGENYQLATNLSSTFQAIKNGLGIVQQGAGTPPPINANFELGLQEMAQGYCAAGDSLQGLIDEIDNVSLLEPDPLLDQIRTDLEGMQQALFQICGQMQTGFVIDPLPFDQMRQSCENLAADLTALPLLLPSTGDRFFNAAEHMQAIAEGFLFATAFVGANMYDGFNDLSERDQFLWTQVARLPNELAQFAKAVDSHAQINISLAPPSFQSWQTEDQGDAIITLVNRDQVNSGNILDEYMDRISETGRLIIRRPDREDGNISISVPLRVRVKYPRHLSRVIDIPAGDGLNITMPELIAGDVNNDDCIDNFDVNQVMFDIGEGGPFAPQVPATDVDGDGQVTFEDVAIVQANVGQCGQSLQDCNYNQINDQTEINDGLATDCNNNGIPDECDIASGFSEDPCNESCACLADINGDGNRDGRDIQRFVECATGIPSATASCRCADMDDNGDIDFGLDVYLFVSLLISGDSCD